jgi:hypothetical protein
MFLIHLLLIPLMLVLSFARSLQVEREKAMERECCIDAPSNPTVGWVVVQNASVRDGRLFSRDERQDPLLVIRGFAPEFTPIVIPPARERIKLGVPNWHRHPETRPDTCDPTRGARIQRRSSTR